MIYQWRIKAGDIGVKAPTQKWNCPFTILNETIFPEIQFFNYSENMLFYFHQSV